MDSVVPPAGYIQHLPDPFRYFWVEWDCIGEAPVDFGTGRERNIVSVGVAAAETILGLFLLVWICILLLQYVIK